MFSLQDQTILITGASAGIGAACARLLAQAGGRLILTARRTDRLEALAAELEQTPCHLLTLDVRDKAQVAEALGRLPAPWQTVDILINNAGLSRGMNKLQEGEVTDWDEMIDTNIKGLLYVTRAIVPGMVTRGRGHVVNLGSLAGHQTYPGGNVYCASKAAVRAISEGLKQDLLGTPIRVTSVDPGLVETDFSRVRFKGDEARAAKVYQGLTPLTAEDIAEVILYCVTRPAHMNINEILLMPTAQSGSTLVHRQY
ncbi:SDR family oxidoreductase [Anthocerotibacter panamensis]|uniref:SDR family oxidoreductase n=1 Tax=Anthocerotibacter panamensis TaxID=2857077 RepID=UPI001C403BE2|nr:SDR family oxidoreductase [Anthocerotibacter panamensis]